MSMVDQMYIPIIDEQGEMGKAANIERRAQGLENTLQRVDAHSNLTLRQVTQVFNMGFNVFTNVLNVFGISLPPIATATIQSLVSMAAAYTAAAAASAAGHDWVAAGLMIVAIISMVSNIASAVASNEATQKALHSSQQLAQSMVSFANSWRYLY
jgi:hypothetical protein